MAKSFRDNDVTALPCLSTTPTFNCTRDVSVVITSSGCWASTPVAMSISPANDRIRVVRSTRFETEAGTENEFILSLTTKKGLLGDLEYACAAVWFATCRLEESLEARNFCSPR